MSYLWAPREFQRGASTEPLEVGARRLGLKLHVLAVRGPADFEGAFGRARESRSEALMVVATNLSVSNRSQLAQLALQNGLLTISDFPLMAHAGFLMSYGADLDDLGRRLVSLMDKILKGTAPGDLPIERPVKLWLTINLRSARALGISIPQAVVARADEVIE